MDDACENCGRKLGALDSAIGQCARCGAHLARPEPDL